MRMCSCQCAVEGHCDPRFEPLRDAFRANFAERGEVGAAVCVMVNNNVVADLYGGWADQEHGRPWQQDTLVNMFSVGKGLVAACTARLAGQGKLDLDATVASYWPEFAAANKDAITVRQLLSAPGRTAVGTPQASPEQHAGLVGHDRRPSRNRTLVGARHRPWLPRQHVRLPGRRGDPPHHRHHGRKRCSATRSPTRSAPTYTSACPPPSTNASPRSSGPARLPRKRNRPAWTQPS